MLFRALRIANKTTTYTHNFANTCSVHSRQARPGLRSTPGIRCIAHTVLTLLGGSRRFRKAQYNPGRLKKQIVWRRVLLYVYYLCVKQCLFFDVSLI